jgi:hypothetical protein
LLSGGGRSDWIMAVLTSPLFIYILFKHRTKKRAGKPHLKSPQYRFNYPIINCNFTKDIWIVKQTAIFSFLSVREAFRKKDSITCYHNSMTIGNIKTLLSNGEQLAPPFY